MNALHLLIEEWVDRQPDACAVRDASTNRELTFRQLWQHSGHLADQLRARGVKRGDFVGIAMHRSVDMIVGVLGIIRAGAAYLALDAHAPVDRIAMMLADADVRLVVEAHAGTGGPAHSWQLPEGVHRLAVPTAIRSTLSGEPDHTTVSVSGSSPAYVAYTSGSTGRPKGVVVPHRAVIRLVMSPNYCTIAPGDRVANSSNPAFDAMTFEVWSTLTAGGTLVVLPTVTDLPLDRWVDMIRAERITTMFLTTSLFHMVARERPTAFRTVDTLIVGGEQLEFAAVRRVLAKDRRSGSSTPMVRPKPRPLPPITSGHRQVIWECLSRSRCEWIGWRTVMADGVFQAAAAVMIWFQTAKRLVISARHSGALIR